MKIVPNRKMLLGGEHVTRGRPVDVADDLAAHAIRMGWAVMAEGKKSKLPLPTEKTDAE